ncbi:MAG: YqjD family protein [Opitutales bacterium]
MKNDATKQTTEAKKATASAVKEKRDALVDDLRQVVEDAQGLLTASKEEFLDEHIDTARQNVLDATNRLKEQGSAVPEKVHEQLEVGREKVTERPLTSMALAAGLGVLIGLLVNRSSQN